MMRDTATIIAQLVGLDGIGPEDVHVPEDMTFSDLWPIGLKNGNGSARPTPVVRPQAHDGVAVVLRWAAETGRRVAVAGARTNVVGAIDRDADVVLSLERLNKIVEFDELSQILTVQAGALGGDVERWLQERGWTTGIYPQSLAISTVGGWVSTRATGTYSAHFGGVEHLVRGVTFVSPTGDEHVVGPHVRVPGGLDVVNLVCGSEGTLAVITAVSLSVHRVQPEIRVCVVFGSMQAGLTAQRELVQQSLRVGLLRLNNCAESREIMGAQLHRDGECLLIATVLGAPHMLEAEHHAVVSVLEGCGGRLVPAQAGDGWYARRYRAAGLMEAANAQPARMFDTIEVSVPWASAAACVGELEQLMNQLSRPFFLHCSHAYTSGVCIYMMLWLTAADDQLVVAKCRDAWQIALDAVERHGGVTGHHHGIGAARSDRYGKSPAGTLHRAIKSSVDPVGVLAASILGPEAGIVAQQGE